MQLAWLEDFVELARTRNFSRAAENRFVTSPAFGRRIRALEEWVGASLAERKQPVSLTPAGMLFLDAATHSLDVLHAARAQLQNTTPHAEETLRIATGRTLAKTFFPDWCESLNRRFGPFLVSLRTGGAQEGIARLSSGDVDLLLSYGSPSTRLLIDPDLYESILLDRETLLPVSAPDVKGRPQFRISATGDTPIPWLAYSPTLTLRSVLSQHLASLPHKLPLHMVCQADSYEAILEMAKRGAGLTWLPQRLVQDELKQGHLTAAGDASMRVSFDISLHRSRRNNNTRLDAIWQGLSSTAKKIRK
ncbi:LysR family transcriptional regulator [Collimonas pratensis]|uniref:Bacterial regulatory helix-turn-helix, lysR family protein n=1 Tax=Collimonas pratensis TaxID=279113 RepID=A0A127QAE4_9BURK|nr:LysR family transcriptional regulator [Collimonas pratensis]AMP07023.1 bacterial regulatory helix-turn-helix, lysR family protein [Collimonas pratensis]